MTRPGGSDVVRTGRAALIAGLPSVLAEIDSAGSGPDDWTGSEYVELLADGVLRLLRAALRALPAPVAGDDELRLLAEAATPGPWQCIGQNVAHYRYGIAHVEHDGIDYSTGEEIPDEVTEAEELADAAYIAAVSPDVVLGLLDRLRANPGNVRAGSGTP